MTDPRVMILARPVRQEEFGQAVDDVLAEIGSALKDKNRAFGNAVLEPIRCFSRYSSPAEQVRVRIDHKLARMMRGSGCDAKLVRSLIGDLVLLEIAERRG